MDNAETLYFIFNIYYIQSIQNIIFDRSYSD